MREKNNVSRCLFIDQTALGAIKIHLNLMNTLESRPKKDIVRIIVISDTHGEHEMLTHMLPPAGDILIHCGDFANKGNKQDVYSMDIRIIAIS